MARLEDLIRGKLLRGLLPSGAVTIVDVKSYGDSAVELTYKDALGQLGTELLFRDDEARLEVLEPGQTWNFDADGALFRLASEARRIQLAHLFDPYLAVHTSRVDPLPHQITAVYESMLPRQPLRFLLADDPGAGKTIMAGLLIRELRIRGDLSRCLIVAPGNLVEQWQEELAGRFDLSFEILTNAGIEAAYSNVFQEKSLLIARLDKLARDEKLQAQLEQTDWDLIICDESHKMSASYFGGEVKYTRRYRLGQLLGRITRHFLLLTATPHNGKEEDFQLFMSLLDPDRFEGRFRDGVHKAEVSDLMRRMTKEKLLKFDATPLFPERVATTVSYQLSPQEDELYRQVTRYVKEEFARADNLEEGRKRTIGFALTILQRRLASSPEAIYQSLKRRRERLEQRLREEQLALFKETPEADLDWEDWDDVPAEEVEKIEEELVDRASAARSQAELRAEIETLKGLEQLAQQVRTQRTDRKWEELSALLQNQAEMFDAAGGRHKLIIFTEHRDTLNYLVERIQALLGRPEAVVSIYGGMARKARKNIEDLFREDPYVFILVATDAAGEGINLQRAHLMINYDLPWNPNRLEQRFGRIHRIGQTEVCHLWNLLAEETREGEVYATLLRKLEQERSSLGGAVFDVLGKAVNGADLRQLMIEAICYGEQPEVRARLKQQVEAALDRERLQDLLENDVLASGAMDTSRVQRIREDLERMAVRRLQPYFIASFFKAAFEQAGGTLRKREGERYEITNTPMTLRQLPSGPRGSVLIRYERICFEKDLIAVEGKPLADFVCPGHPLLDATLGWVLKEYQPLLKQGTVLVDPYDWSEAPRLLVYLEHTVQDGQRVVSRRMQFVELPVEGPGRNGGPAPYQDYDPLPAEDWPFVQAHLDQLVNDKNWAARAMSYAVDVLAKGHLREVREVREPLIEKTAVAVKERLTKEIVYWDRQTLELQAQELAGKPNARLNSVNARQRANDLEARLKRRLAELEAERRLSALPPVIIGAALIVPKGLLARLKGESGAAAAVEEQNRKRVEMIAMKRVIDAERALGYVPKDVSQEKLGYDIESLAGGGRLRFIEVKGVSAGVSTVTVTRNEILKSFNAPDSWILALVEVPREGGSPADHRMKDRGQGYVVAPMRYVRNPFNREPDFNAVSVDYDFEKLWQAGDEPE